jgi:hypothetical protein
MSANNTTPQPRVNKLGHVVTKHVLNSTAAAPSKTALPAPAAVAVQVAPVEARDAKIERLIVEMNIAILYGKESDEHVRASLATFSDSTLDLISTTAAWHRSMGLPRLRFMLSVITETRESSLRGIMSMVPLFRDDLTTEDTSKLACGLRHLDQFNGQNLEDLTGRDRELAADLINVAAVVYLNLGDDVLEETDDEYGEPTMHVHQDLADLIASHPTQVEAIKGFIRDRDTADVEVIREYLQIGALRDGVL